MGRSIYQLYHKLPEVQGRVIQTSSWVIGGHAAGINFREGKAGTDFSDSNPFIPHYVKPSKTGRQQLNFVLSRIQNIFREDLLEGYTNADWDGIYTSSSTISSFKHTVVRSSADIYTKDYKY